MPYLYAKMVSITKYIIIFLLMIDGVAPLISQDADIAFYYYGADNKKINSLGQLEIAEDGRVWLGTWGQGLFVFDGYHFEHYMHNPENSIDLKSNYIVGLYQNSRGRMMVGTTKNLLEFDYPRQVLYYPSFVEDSTESASLARSEGILELDDNLWLATGNGILKCSYADGTCERIKMQVIHAPEAYFDNYFYKIIKDPYKEILWLNSAYGLKYLDMKDNTIHQINSPKSFHDMGIQYKQHKLWDMYLDTHHRLWFAAITSGGVLCYEIDQEKWVVYKQPIASPNQDPSYGNKVACLAYVNDSLIIYANQIGIGKVDFQSNTLKQFNSYDLEKGGWIKKLEFDKNGILWGTGLNAVIRSKLPLKETVHEIRPPVILSISKNKKIFRYANWQQDTISSDIEEIKLEIGVINPIEPNKTLYQWRVNNSAWSSPSNKRLIDLSNLNYGSNQIAFRASSDGVKWINGQDFYCFLLKPYYLKPRFIALLFSLLCVISISMWFIVKRAKSIRLEKRRAHERLLAQMEMKSLRAQMNPHFIFNSLNSISSFIYKNENELATEYLAKFAKLMRSVLRNSEEKLITLAEEISIAKMYLELERLRFGNKFEFNFLIHDNINTDEVYIPPLLLQPFLENAIWHGILHQSKKGKLHLSIFQSAGKLEIEIIDNGIGRAASKKSKKNSMKKESYGLNITQNRLGLVSLVYEIRASSRIIDLYGDDAKAIGTKVIIELPILNNNDYESNNY